MKNDISRVNKAQEKFFKTHQTREVDFRLDNLKKMKQLLLTYENQLYNALWADLRKPAFEAYAGEIGFVLQELNLHIRKLKKWTKPRRVRTPLLHFYSTSFIYPEPYGRVLIFSPWNFPFQLAFAPLIGALSAGNCVVLKPSQHTPHTACVMQEIIGHFDPQYIAFFTGGHEMNQELLEEKYDYIFFTGSARVGKIILEKAAKNLTPVSLELGGKNPCIVHHDAPIALSAKRIAWGKFFNAGQSCVAPDYLLIHQDIRDAFLEKLIRIIRDFYGENPEMSPDYPRVVNPSNVTRLQDLMSAGKTVTGGNINPDEKYIAPTVIDGLHPDDPIMESEVFGPILPVLSYSTIEEAFNIIHRHPRPLACYLFTTNRRLQKRVLHEISFGTATLNDTVIHFINPYLPFGGVGNSGIGKYHGKKSFDTFTHYKSILKKTHRFDFPIRYPPYTKQNQKLLKRLLR